MSAIPFENADIMLGRGVRTDLPSVVDKLVHRGRGGYCFEHGQLLAAALVQLGYPVDRLLARVGGPHDTRSHLVVRVQVDGQDWLADTGFGTGLIEPVPFDGGAPTRSRTAAPIGWRADGETPLAAAGSARATAGPPCTSSTTSRSIRPTSWWPATSPRPTPRHPLSGSLW